MKNIFDEFNNIDIDLDEYADVPLDDTEVNDIKERVCKKLNNKKKVNFKPMAAIVAGVIITTMAINYDAVSASIDKLSKTLRTYFTEYNIDRDFVDYTNIVGNTITDKDIGVTLDEFIIDNNLIIINYTINLSKVQDKILKEDLVLDIEVNGNEARDGVVEIKDLGGGKYNYISIYSFDNLEVKGPLEVKISYNFYELIPYKEIKNEEAYKAKKLNGNWNFNFNINDNNVEGNIERVTLTENNTIRLGNRTLTFTEAIKSDISIRLKCDIAYDDVSKMPLSSFGSEHATVRDGMPNVKPDFCITDDNGQWLELGVRKTKNTKGEYQYFLKDAPNEKFTVEIPYGVGIVPVDFSE